MNRALKYPVTVGQPFHKWTVIEVPCGYYAICQCECGRTSRVRTENLIHGKSRSCMPCRRPTNLQHGHARGPAKFLTYVTWQSMVQRCADPSSIGWKNYGARGITVCERWRTFTNFLEDMGEHPGRPYTIERQDYAQGYSKDNCCWLPRFLQGRNKSNNHLLTFQGETHPVSVWSEITGIVAKTIYSRLYQDWSIEKTLSTPVRSWSRGKPFRQQSLITSTSHAT
jgi:hypothetical protein